MFGNVPVKLQKPEKIENLMQAVKRCLDKGRYILTEHVLQRLNERCISVNDLEYVLKNGYHEVRKTSFDEHFLTWKYAIRGKTVESQDIRVIVAFDDDGLVVITIMHVGGELRL